MSANRLSAPKMIAIVAFWTVAALFVLPVAAALALCLLTMGVYRACRNLPAVRRARNRRQARRLYEHSLVLRNQMPPPTPDEFAEGVIQRLIAAGHNPSIAPALSACARTLYEAESLAAVPPPPALDVTDLDAARYRDRLSGAIEKLAQPDGIEIAADTVAEAYGGVCRLLPPIAADQAETAESHLTVRLIDVLPEIPEAIETLLRPFWSHAVIPTGFFAELRERLDRNRHEMSGVPFTPQNYGSPKLVTPAQHQGTAEETVHGYLRDTPFEKLFFADVPFVLPDSIRFEHQWIVAGSGHGKSQTLQYQIARDLERVSAGEASLVVIDSQADLIQNVARLKVFAPGGPLHGKLCLIDPSDIEYPVALNLFDVSLDRISQYSPLDRERLMNGVLELYDFVLGSLLSAELTQKQSVIFRYITRLMLHIPGATIHTFRELMEPKGYDRYRPYIERLDGTARAFFETEFNSKQFEDTKRQVVRRLWGILENQTFERMFSHPKNKLDLFSEMNLGRVILINTAKDLLKQTGTEIFGRFFIALIAQASQERATLPKDRRKPAFVYIDECADYLDQNVALILEQARKMNVSMALAMQYIGQASPRLQESLGANTSTKFAGGVSDKDARALSHNLRCTPEFILGQKKGHFAAFARNFMPSAVSVRIPFGHMEAMPRMTAEEFHHVRAEIRERYAVHWKDVGRATASSDSARAQSSSFECDGDATPSSEW